MRFQELDVVLIVRLVCRQKSVTMHTVRAGTSWDQSKVQVLKSHYNWCVGCCTPTPCSMALRVGGRGGAAPGVNLPSPYNIRYRVIHYGKEMKIG